MSTITVIGSGGMAAAIASLAARAGFNIEITGRDGKKAQALASKVGPNAATSPFGAVPAGDIVVLAVPYSAVLDVVARYGERLAGKVLVDITNPVAADRTSFVTPADSSGAQEITKAAPADAHVVKAFNTQFSHVLAEGATQGRSLDILVAGDDPQAKARIEAFARDLGLRPFDVGSLSMARTLEHVCLLSLGLIRHSVKHTDYAIGIEVPA